MESVGLGLPNAGHFVQGWDELVAHAALAHFDQRLPAARSSVRQAVLECLVGTSPYAANTNLFRPFALASYRAWSAILRS